MSRARMLLEVGETGDCMMNQFFRSQDVAGGRNNRG